MKSSSPLCTRFAPAPTGQLHAGGARTALFNYLAARKYGGKFILRIEDTDPEASSPRYVEDILASLHFLGIGWDEGPYFQSQRQEIYQKYLKILQEKELVYPCFCTEAELQMMRKEQQARKQPPGYDGRCRLLGKKEREKKFSQKIPYVWRFQATSCVTLEDKLRGKITCQEGEIKDFVLTRHNGTFTFLFANALDDALMGMTLVIRGEDHLHNTFRQLMLFKALSLPEPTYLHLPLITAKGGKKLSKRAEDLSVLALREEGYLAEAIVQTLAFLGFWHPEKDKPHSLAEIVELFDFNYLSLSPSVFDLDQLNYWNRVFIKRLPIEKLHQQASFLYPEKEGLKEFLLLMRENMKTLKDLEGVSENLKTPAPFPLSEEEKKFLKATQALLDQNLNWEEILNQALALSQVKKKEAFVLLRKIFYQGKTGPSVLALLDYFGKTKVKERVAWLLAENTVEN